MKKIDLAQTVSILANLGVIAGLLFLAVELRQNRELLGIEIRTNSQNRIAGVTDLVLANPYLVELLHRDQTNLTPQERDTLVLLGMRNLSNFEIAYEDAMRGLADEAALQRRLRAVWHRPNLNYGMPLAWPVFRERGSPDFVAWVEQNVIDTE